MYLVTLTRYVGKGIYADPYTIFKWVAVNEDQANQFMEKLVNLLDMESGYGDSWYKEVVVDEELSLFDELILDMEAVDSVDSHDDLQEIVDYIIDDRF